MNRKTIFLTQIGGAGEVQPTPADEHASSRLALAQLTSNLNAALAQRRVDAAAPHECSALLALLAHFLDFMARADSEHGPDSSLPLQDADLACADALRAAAALEGWLSRFDLEDFQVDLDTVILGISLWAMRHGCALDGPEPMVNALARLSNRAGTRQDVAAAFALMQGAIEFLKPRLAADLEQSNPERPWRMLHLNFAITGIRSGDAALAEHAFSALNAGLPLERKGFYAEALQLATQSGLPSEMTALIRTQLEALSARH